MKLTKCGTLVNKTTYLFTSMRDSNNSRGCAKILELGGEVGGGGEILGANLGRSRWEGVHTANPFHGGGMDISGTTQCESRCTAEEVSCEWL